MDKDHWLIRTKDLFISRPMSQKELVKKIENGDLNPLDEICPATGYWFGLHEVEEVRAHLGNVDLTKLSSGLEIEITSSTETTTAKKTLILEVPKTWSPDPEKKSILTPTHYTLTEVPSPTSAAAAASAAARNLKPRDASYEGERQWAPALIFATLFAVVLIFLWMHSD